MTLSNAIKNSRLDVLKLKESIMRELLNKAVEETKNWMTNEESSYKKFLNDLILEALFLLGNETTVNVYCREEDYKYLSQQGTKISDAFEKKQVENVQLL